MVFMTLRNHPKSQFMSLPVSIQSLFSQSALEGMGNESDCMKNQKSKECRQRKHKGT